MFYVAIDVSSFLSNAADKRTVIHTGIHKKNVFRAQRTSKRVFLFKPQNLHFSITY